MVLGTGSEKAQQASTCETKARSDEETEIAALGEKQTNKQHARVLDKLASPSVTSVAVAKPPKSIDLVAERKSRTSWRI